MAGAIRVSAVAEVLVSAHPQRTPEQCVSKCRNAESVRASFEALWADDVESILRAHGGPEGLAMIQEAEEQRAAAEARTAEVQRAVGASSAATGRLTMAQMMGLVSRRESDLVKRAVLERVFGGDTGPSSSAATRHAPTHIPLDDDTGGGVEKERATSTEPSALAPPPARQHDQTAVADDGDDKEDGHEFTDEELFGWYVPYEDDINTLQLLPRGDDYAQNVYVASTELMGGFKPGPEGWRCASLEWVASPEDDDLLQAAARGRHEWLGRHVYCPSSSPRSHHPSPTVEIPHAPYVLPLVHRSEEVAEQFGDVFCYGPMKQCSIARELHRVWLMSTEGNGAADDPGQAAETPSAPPSDTALAPDLLPTPTKASWEAFGPTLAPLLRAVMANRLVSPKVQHDASIIRGVPFLGERRVCLGPMRMRTLDLLPTSITIDPSSGDALLVTARDLYCELHPIRFVLRPTTVKVEGPDLVVNPTASATGDPPPENAAGLAAGSPVKPRSQVVALEGCRARLTHSDGAKYCRLLPCESEPMGIIPNPSNRHHAKAATTTTSSTSGSGGGGVGLHGVDHGLQADGRPVDWLSPVAEAAGEDEEGCPSHELEMMIDPNVVDVVGAMLDDTCDLAAVDLYEQQVNAHREPSSPVAEDASTVGAVEVNDDDSASSSEATSSRLNAQRAVAAARQAMIHSCGDAVTGSLRVRVKRADAVLALDYGYRANNTLPVLRIDRAAVHLRRVSVAVSVDGHPAVGGLATGLARLLKPMIRRSLEQQIAQSLVRTHNL